MTGCLLKVNKRLRPGKVPVIYPQDEFMEATPGIEPGYAVLQTAASPLRHVAERGRGYIRSLGEAMCACNSEWPRGA